MTVCRTWIDFSNRSRKNWPRSPSIGRREKQAVHDEVERRPALGEFDEEERRLMDRVIFPRVEKVAELFPNATLSPEKAETNGILSVDSIKRPSSRRPRG